MGHGKTPVPGWLKSKNGAQKQGGRWDQDNRGMPTMSTSQVLQHLYSLDSSSPEFLHSLYCLIQVDNEEQYLINLQGSELSCLVNFLDGVGALPLASFHAYNWTL